jgi:hypothetical protein
VSNKRLSLKNKRIKIKDRIRLKIIKVRNKVSLIISNKLAKLKQARRRKLKNKQTM